MFYSWLVTAEVNMSADKIKRVFVKAKTEEKAKAMAEQMLKRAGYFHIMILNVEKTPHN